MKNLKETGEQYFKVLKDRSQTSKVYKPYQLTGLAIAEILDDKAHKSLYIKLAKQYGDEELLRLAKTVAERKAVANKGAYFMKILKSSGIKKK